jgi:hypothetical protein
MNCEVFLKVDDYPYLVSNRGRVYSLHSNQILSLNEDKDGYLLCHLKKNGERKVFKVHRLVYRYFGEDKLGSKNINHIDGSKKNNHIENLECCTHSQNMKHAVENDLLKNCTKFGENHNTSKFSFREVQEIREKYSSGNYTMRELATKYETSCGYISDIVNKNIRQNI